MLLLVAMVGRVVVLAMVVGDRVDDAGTMVPVGNGTTERMPPEGRFVLIY